MLGFGPLGKWALGQVSNSPGPIVVGAFGTGVAGVISAATGSVPGAHGIGVAGTIMPTTLAVNPHRLLANVLRRTRKLGRLVPRETI
jgi:hypothetical protein